MSGLSQGTSLSNLKYVPLTAVKQLEFNAQNFRGHMTYAHFQQIFRGYVQTVRWNMLVKFEVHIFK